MELKKITFFPLKHVRLQTRSINDNQFYSSELQLLIIVWTKLIKVVLKVQGQGLLVRVSNNWAKIARLLWKQLWNSPQIDQLVLKYQTPKISRGRWSRMVSGDPISSPDLKFREGLVDGYRIPNGTVCSFDAKIRVTDLAQTFFSQISAFA